MSVISTEPWRSAIERNAAPASIAWMPAKIRFDEIAWSRAPRTDPRAAALEAAVRRVGRATADIARFGRETAPLPHQRIALDTARQALDATRADASRDLAAAFASDPRLIEEAVKGRTAAVVRAMQLEAELRTRPELRADRFVAAWQQLRIRREKLQGWENEAARKSVEQRMVDMGKSLERDPQVESLLRKRVSQLGLPDYDGRRLSQSIPDWLGLSRGRGIGM